MSNILAQNPIRYNIDTLQNDLYALIVMKAGHFLDCTEATQITGFNFSYEQPENTQIKFLFTTGDSLDDSQMYEPGTTHGHISDETESGSWFKLNSAGYAVPINSQGLSYESVLENGNTISELQALNNIPAFTGYKVRAAIALMSPDNNAVPSVSFSLKAINTTQQLTRTEYSPIYELGQDAQIINIVADIQEINNANIAIYGDIDESDNWELINNLAGQEAKTLQIKAILTAPAVNSSQAILNNIKIIYSSGSGIISGDGISEIISRTHNWHRPVKHCRCVIKHALFRDSSMKVYASFRALPSICEGEILGTGDGRLHTYQLANSDGINLESVKIYFDGVQIFTGYEVNCEVGRVTCTAPAGVIVTCDYEYGWGGENWQELEFSRLTRKNEYDESEYYLRVNQAGYICAVKIALQSQTGIIANEILGKGTGGESTYKLTHIVREGEIEIFANNSPLSAKNYNILDDGQHVKIAASSGATLKANYSWISESPAIYEFHAVFSE